MFAKYECVNCSHQALSVREVNKCSKCGATVVCTSPNEKEKPAFRRTSHGSERHNNTK